MQDESLELSGSSRIHDVALTASVEATMAGAHGSLYELA